MYFKGSELFFDKFSIGIMLTGGALMVPVSLINLITGGEVILGWFFSVTAGAILSAGLVHYVHYRAWQKEIKKSNQQR